MLRSSSITVENGTIQGWTYGVCATGCSNVHIAHIKFVGLNELAEAVFNGVSSSSINYCAFTGSATYGILDEGTQTGNNYTDDTFDGGQTSELVVEYITEPLMMTHGNFQP